MWRKALWRFARTAVYALLSGYLTTWGASYGLDNAAVVALLTGIMAALDKAFGIGAMVKDATASK